MNDWICESVDSNGPYGAYGRSLITWESLKMFFLRSMIRRVPSCRMEGEIVTRYTHVRRRGRLGMRLGAHRPLNEFRWYDTCVLLPWHWSLLRISVRSNEFRPTPRIYAFFAVRSGLDFESAVTAQNDDFKGSFDSSFSRSLNVKTQCLDSILTDKLVQCIAAICTRKTCLHSRGNFISTFTRRTLTNWNDVKYVFPRCHFDPGCVPERLPCLVFSVHSLFVVLVSYRQPLADVPRMQPAVPIEHLGSLERIFPVALEHRRTLEADLENSSKVR